MNRLQALHDAGVSIWLDTLSREPLDSGDLAGLIADCAVTGAATSNPTREAYARYRERFPDERWRALRDGTKNPDYSDVLYVEERIAPAGHQHHARGHPACPCRPRRRGPPPQCRRRRGR